LEELKEAFWPIVPRLKTFLILQKELNVLVRKKSSYIQIKESADCQLQKRIIFKDSFMKTACHNSNHRIRISEY